MKHVRGSVAAVVLTLAIAGGAAGCTGSSGSSSGSSARSDTAAGVSTLAAGNGGAVPAPAGGTAAPAVAVASPDRQVVTTASARLRVREVTRAVDAISARVETAGGHVEQRSSTDPGAGASAGATHLVLRVPASALPATLRSLSSLGTVTRVTEENSDVTATSVDLAARISALQASTARLEHLLATAATTADLVAAESALTDRQAQLESLQAQSAALAGQVALSTLTLTVEPRSAAATTGATGFAGGLSRGWHALAVSGADLLVVLGALLPWLVAAAVLGALVVAAVRAARRLRRRPHPAE